MLEPAVLQNEIVIARLLCKPRPDADHGLKPHVVQLLVHGRRIGKSVGNEIELAHGVVIKPVEYQHIGRQMPLTISLGNVQHLFLRDVALLALHESVRSFGQHRCRSG